MRGSHGLFLEYPALLCGDARVMTTFGLVLTPNDIVYDLLIDSLAYMLYHLWSDVLHHVTYRFHCCDDTKVNLIESIEVSVLTQIIEAHNELIGTN